MTETTPTTTPTPPEGLTDARLLELAAAAIDGYDSIAPGEFEPEAEIAVEAYGSELIAAMRAAIAADRDQRAQTERSVDPINLVKAGIRFGYMAGHNDTVEACYGDPDSVAEDYAAETLSDVRPTPAAVPSFLDAIRLANGCHDYSGGYGGAEGEAWHAGIGTVVDVLRRAATRPWDSQTAATFAMGSDTPAPTPEEIEAQFRAWWKASYPSAPVNNAAVGYHVAFALHLLGRGVQ